MNIIELGAIGELVGGVAVIATLIYLAMQIRQSTTVAQGAAERDLIEGMQTLNDRMAQNAAALRQGLHSFDTMSKDEQLTFAHLFNPFMNYLEQALRMHTRGLLTQDNVDLFGNICLSFIQEPGGRIVWERQKHVYFSRSRDYVQHRLDAGRNLPSRISESIPWWALDSTAATEA